LSQNLTSQFITSESDRLALEEKLNVLQAERTQLQKRLAQLPLKQQPLTSLVRQREEAAASFKLLQSKLEEARIAEAQLVGNVRIIEQAQLPLQASGPNKKAIFVVAVVFGTILAVGIILLLEVMDNTLHDVSEVEELVKLPILGVLPDIPNSAIGLDQPESFLDNVALVEPYRRLLKKLEFHSKGKLQIIIVSSTLAGEGKSLIVSHLAAVSAMLSRRTLIIDADLHQPRQHNLLCLSQEPGLTDVIAKKIALLHAVQPTGIENLSLLSCGELCDRPSSLVESTFMQSLLEEVVGHYDLIVVDTPPVSSCADANTLSRHSDGLVMVTRPNFTSKEMLVQAISELTGTGASILGIIVNGITDQTQKHYHSRVEGDKSRSQSIKHFTHLETLINNSARR
jgi:capsular exopolysaccharide synthesis family protein